MHLDDERLQRLLDGELSGSDELAAREHLATCNDCRHRAAAAQREEREVEVLLGALDDRLPEVPVETVTTSVGTRTPELVRVAAGLAIALVLAGAAYAIPGSPVPRWVDAVVGWFAGPPSPTTSVPPAPDTGVAGVAILPGDALLIEFTSRQSAGHARISLSEASALTVRAPIGAATFSSDADRLVIDNHGSTASFEIRIPRGAPSIEVRVDGRTIFLKAGSSITAVGPDEASGSYVVPLTPGR